MLASGKTGEGAYAHVRGSVILQRDDHYRPTIATWVHDLYTFTGCLMDKTGEGAYLWDTTVYVRVHVIGTIMKAAGWWGYVDILTIGMNHIA